MGITYLDIWEQKLDEAIKRTNAAVLAWRNRKATVDSLTARMDDYNRAKWASGDRGLRDAMDDYGFWQREVLRLSAQVQTEYLRRISRNGMPLDG